MGIGSKALAEDYSRRIIIAIEEIDQATDYDIDSIINGTFDPNSSEDIEGDIPNQSIDSTNNIELEYLIEDIFDNYKIDNTKRFPYGDRDDPIVDSEEDVEDKEIDAIITELFEDDDTPPIEEDNTGSDDSVSTNDLDSLVDSLF